jgi:hypothetical protein
MSLEESLWVSHLYQKRPDPNFFSVIGGQLVVHVFFLCCLGVFFWGCFKKMECSLQKLERLGSGFFLFFNMHPPLSNFFHFFSRDTHWISCGENKKKNWSKSFCPAGGIGLYTSHEEALGYIF